MQRELLLTGEKLKSVQIIDEYIAQSRKPAVVAETPLTKVGDRVFLGVIVLNGLLGLLLPKDAEWADTVWFLLIGGAMTSLAITRLADPHFRSYIKNRYFPKPNLLDLGQ